ncbi:unnamed protein product [Polarella glacialis]|uniref:C2H2-type domain-containing protein n=1 Tax=Polarella glacialis TaxID=89957 RepID=A0A813D1T7_POLGL|nr:unnamed protein product [Polarella glacialis]
MGVKNSHAKQARKELKKTLRSLEVCPHCRKKLSDLEEHIKTVHSFSCARCGQRFTNEQGWKHHMRDRHGLEATQAVKEDRHNKLERWVKNGKKAKDANGMAEDTPSQDAASSSAPQLYCQVCELCGAAAELAVDLRAQGLSFSCAFLGRPCGGASSGARQQAVVPFASMPSATGFRPPPIPDMDGNSDGDDAIDMAVPSDDDDL